MDKSKKSAKRPRRSFTPEFKAEAVRLCRIGDRSIARVGVDLNLGETALRDWVRRAEIDAGNGLIGALTSDELARLRRENKRVFDGFGNFKKSGGVLRERKPMKFQFVHVQKYWFPITARGADRARSLDYANRRLQVARHLMRMANEMKLISDKSAVYVAALQVDLGNQVGSGWIMAKNIGLCEPS